MKKCCRKAALFEIYTYELVETPTFFELFAQADEAYRRRVLPTGAVRVGIEAAARMGWDRWLMGERGREAKAGFVGMDSFGASAPAEVLFEKFGFTVDNVVAQVEKLL